MQALRTARMITLLPASAVRHSSATCRTLVAPALQIYTPSQKLAEAQVGLGAPVSKRNAGASAIAAGIAISGVGMSTVGVGLIFSGLVQGMARNFAYKDDLFTYALIGMGIVEFFAIVTILFAGLLLYSE
mmetsp:Transcript_69366/g.120182  ORF Transcript_69366/g.120182 Transcript_69366/m.120182 type:complete len:130 (-) Transcript_69366:52-441(-)